MDFTSSLEKQLLEHAHPENAMAMEKYMRNHFCFYGIKTDIRRRIFKTNCLAYTSEINQNSRAIATELFSKEQREFHYCAIELLIKNLKENYNKEDIKLIEQFIIKNSWWDSVDTIAKYLLGEYLFVFPKETEAVIERFSNSANIWLNRSAILFQLGYKQKTNFDLLRAECEKHKHSTEFFIQKAIGWALREYAKTNPKAVLKYVQNTNLKPLSSKEALKNIL